MIEKYITYNGISSKEMGLRLIDDVEFESAENSIDLIEIDGVNGAKIKNNKSLKLVDRKYPFALYKGVGVTLNVKYREEKTVVTTPLKKYLKKK